jgi:hypothetical protein
MTKEASSIRAVVLEVLEAVSGRSASELCDFTPLMDTKMDSLSVVALLSLVADRCGASFDSDATAEIMRSSDIGALIEAIARAAARRRA